jgi:hypothetical protein
LVNAASSHSNIALNTMYLPSNGFLHTRYLKQSFKVSNI